MVWLNILIKAKKPPCLGAFFSDRGRIRTFDRLLRRQMLYPAELRDQTLRVQRY